MTEFSDVQNLRRRYIIAFSTIAVLVTGAWLGMRIIVDKQHNFSKLISIAGQQSGLSERIAHFATQMVAARDSEDFNIAKAQLGRAIANMEAAHRTLLNGDPDGEIPYVTTPVLQTIYFDPSVGLNGAITRYLSHARAIYSTPRDSLGWNSASYVFVLQYGPYVLEAMFTAATDEYDMASREAIEWIKQLETALWLGALVVLSMEVLFIFHPLENRLRKSLTRLTDSNAKLKMNLNAVKTARREAETARDKLDRLNQHLEERVEMRTRELSRELERHERTEARLRASKREQECANRAKSDFLANMSHELRTPLNAIIGFSNILRTDMFGPLANAKQKEYIEDIHHSGEHLLELINDILDVSALEAGKLKLNEEPLNLCAVIDLTWRLVGTRAEDKGVELRQNVPDTLAWLHADERRIKQILLNLLTNAIKFTPRGGTVTLNAKCNGTRTISLSVSDTGIGMDEHDVAKAMSQFGQVDNVFSRTEEGTGLGLPLTKGLVELHDGRMEIESEKGCGTRITVHFPKERTIDPIDGMSSESALATAPSPALSKVSA
ncbi:ATP-binding protein [Magnetovibrio sp.]|uniref:ATP-binding protein n=1 Tax=Magnetovibrio sp. TaxID=2024836 RepID=UPI002F921013